MTNVVIIEDEPLARDKLRRMLQNLGEPIEVVAELGSVAEVKHWLATNSQAVDVIFSDIELSDGNVFAAYEHDMPPAPLIFVTAYDAFMLEAFESQGIAYLLKPYSGAKLAQAWQKFKQLTQKAVAPSAPTQSANEPLQRIAIRTAQQVYFMRTGEFAYIKADGNLIMGFDQQNRRHYLPFPSLQALEKHLDSRQFFRINRSEIVNVDAIDKLERYCKNSYLVLLKNGAQLKTSQSRTSTFNQWLS
ncbi:LytR/AlgR family response regulator transcription factor [Pseudidiomarina salilacus]|uniref:LytR/AlgR family response regulator transcription factor n=1 Tax=Pseudidiomarina salilacus TaxID=3384452 RepID=UPI003984D24E